ncbi:MAG TPA: 2OG-Fe(II) oxygenase [Rhizomicrobium sp.]|nr:2OG-Fe(II) oxygenase [Rhizomicrobium sp.]
MAVDLNTFRSTPARAEPYPHLIVPGFLNPENASRVIADYPNIDVGGVFMPDAAPYGPAVTELMADLESPAMRRIVEEKLDLDLAGRPTLTTFRSRCRLRDGRMHTDSKFKLATLLLYINESWEPSGGRLRVLRSGDDIENYADEVPPDGGTLFCFKVQDNSWHGHLPFSGVRRCVMVNYCVDEAVRDSEAARHRLSMRWKKFRKIFMGAEREQAA